ncbi:MAG: hypothetical protein ACJ74Z_12050, partial [Bryobacteraceae bacterium]
MSDLALKIQDEGLPAKLILGYGSEQYNKCGFRKAVLLASRAMANFRTWMKPDGFIEGVKVIWAAIEKAGGLYAGIKQLGRQEASKWAVEFQRNPARLVATAGENCGYGWDADYGDLVPAENDVDQ